MALPKQAQQDQADVDAYEKALQEQTTEQVVELTSAEVVAEIQPVAAPAEVTPAEPVVEVAKVVELKKPEEPWQQRYQTLKGMFDSEVPRLHAQVKELNREIGGLKESIEKLKVIAPVPALDSSVTDEEEETFGKDLIDVQRRIAREAVAPVLAQVATLEQENSALRELLGKTGSKVEALSFDQRLQIAIPNFDQINVAPEWVAWLNEVDPILRGPRRNVAQAAFESGDVDAIAEYVKLFEGMTAPPAAPSPDKSEAELRSQVAPSRTVSASAPSSKEGEKFYTEAEAGRLFDKVSSLNRAGKYEEASKLDAELTAAYNHGRVR